MQPEDPTINFPTGYKEIYALLGEFIVEFQELHQMMRIAIMVMSDINGKDRARVAKLLTIEMTSILVLKSYNSIARALRNLTSFEVVVISKIYDRVLILIQKRNELIHGDWGITVWEDEGIEDSMVSGSNTKHTKRGIHTHDLIMQEAEFRSLINECEALSELISASFQCLRDKMEFGKLFMIDDKGFLMINPNFVPPEAD